MDATIQAMWQRGLQVMNNWARLFRAVIWLANCMLRKIHLIALLLLHCWALPGSAVFFNRDLPLAFSRVATETNSVVKRPAWGTNNGPATVTVKVDGTPMPVIMTDALKWRTTLELTPGAHVVRAEALHSSLRYTAVASNNVTNNATPDTVTSIFDGNGNQTLKVWKSGSVTNRIQRLSFDAKNRLVFVSERDSTQSGYDYTAIYDPLDRLVRTVEAPVAGGVTNTSKQVVIEQYYDPEVEFLVLGVNENGLTTWKFMGPDLTGVYGGLNGQGGFEAIVPGVDQFCPIVSDARGNLLCVNDPKHGGLLWNSSRPTGYGSIPGFRPPPLGHGRSLVESSAWGGKWMSIICGYHIGLRTLWSDSAQWASADPAGHGGSENLMSYAGGNPINLTDVDGRCNAAFNTVRGAILDDALSPSRPLNEFLGNARYLGGDGGALDRLSSSFLNSGDYGLPSDFAHHYVANPVTPMDGLTVRNFSGGWDDLSHREQFSSFLNWVPGVGALKGAAETVFGEDFISGKEASRWQGAAMVGMSLAPFGGMARGAAMSAFTMEGQFARRAELELNISEGRGLIGLVRPGGTIDPTLRAVYSRIANSSKFEASLGRYNSFARRFGLQEAGDVAQIDAALANRTTFARTPNFKAGLFTMENGFYIQGNPTTAYGARVARHELVHFGAALQGQGDTILHEIGVQWATTPENLVIGGGIIAGGVGAGIYFSF